MHLKRTETPKNWPLPRKGTKYIVKPLHNLKNSLPLLVIVRDILNFVENRKELKKILNSGKIKINGKIVKEDRFPVNLFDVVSLDSKNFRLILKNKKFNLDDVKEKEAEEKTAKIIGKKILKKGKVQVNLSDGRNYLFKEKTKTGDSVIINFKENKISEVLPLKKGAKIIFIAGKHLGEVGIIEEIDEKNKIITLKAKDGKINSKPESLMVIK